MLREEQVPKEFIALSMEAFSDDLHSVAERNLTDLGIAEDGRPGFNSLLKNLFD
jgi:hypothetical protein